MKLLSEGIHYEFNKRLYWTRITAQLEEGEAIILVCASRRYIADKYHIQDAVVTAEYQERWLKDALEDIQNSGEELVVGDVYTKVYANTPEGESNGMKFLNKEVKP